MKPLLLAAIASVFTFQPACATEPLRVAAAADLRYALSEVREAFVKAHPGTELELIFGSSGKLAAQIENGAPFDLFFSADIDFALRLAARGLTVRGPVPYARGRIVLWWPGRDASRLTLAALVGERFRKVAIANPRHAPYGQRAEQVLRKAGVLAAVQPKLVLGENVSHAAQLVESGAADAGLIAYSLALGRELTAAGSFVLVPEELHEPLDQAYCVLKRAASDPRAGELADFCQGERARGILRTFGFVLPGERQP
ncbi:MAG: molybdate ABC transporter substrate-binding protein [Candidatus Riflebacteria bacterium]|nr:molybdate ABC transporter substrate-binding protein [Candidatus Riflebacteria bacterium]